jgi:hypothetical protein
VSTASMEMTWTLAGDGQTSLMRRFIVWPATKPLGLRAVRTCPSCGGSCVETGLAPDTGSAAMTSWFDRPPTDYSDTLRPEPRHMLGSSSLRWAPIPGLWRRKIVVVIDLLS